MPFAENQIRNLAVAVIRKGNKILVTEGVDYSKKETFFRLPGGGIEFGETAAETLQREFWEEFGAEIEIDRQMDVVENIFCYENKKGHEIVFIFEARLKNIDLYKNDELPIVEDGAQNAKALWKEITADTIIYPEAVREILKI